MATVPNLNPKTFNKTLVSVAFGVLFGPVFVCCVRVIGLVWPGSVRLVCLCIRFVLFGVFSFVCLVGLYCCG